MSHSLTKSRPFTIDRCKQLKRNSVRYETKLYHCLFPKVYLFKMLPISVSWVGKKNNTFRSETKVYDSCYVHWLAPETKDMSFTFIWVRSITIKFKHIMKGKVMKTNMNIWNGSLTLAWHERQIDTLERNVPIDLTLQF